jgi:hypothetical protein
MAQCSRVLENDLLPGASIEFDGVSVMTVTDPRLILESQKERKHVELLLPDELIVFTDYVSKSMVTAKETVIHARPIEKARDKFVVIDFVTRRDGYSHDDFAAGWREHAARMTDLPGFETTVLRYVHNAVYGARPLSHDYDGVFELWFDTRDDVGRFYTPDVRDAVDRSFSSFADSGRHLTLLTFVSHAFYRKGVLSAAQAH